jgi:phage gp29-like protein
VGFFSRIKAALSPAKLTSGVPVVDEKPLYAQFQRIGGGLAPSDVTMILLAADAGQPSRLIDLFNESRQKDGHLQSVCWTRESAVALCDVSFVEAEKGSKKRDQKAIDLCRRVVAEFENWPTLIEHLTASFLAGHATCSIDWRQTTDGYLLPYRAKPIPIRDFIFSQKEGALRYAARPGDIIGVDLLADNPGRIVQLTRRINGDVLVREGLIRALVWSALFRNWNIRDWIALGEVGWKPWRIGKYEPGTDQKEIDQLVAALERIGRNGCAAVPSNCELEVEWPKGSGPSGASVHREFFDTIGREISKAVIGQTTTIESGPNGDRASTQTRDQVRLDVRESDAVAVAAVLRAHLFSHVVAVNIGPAAKVPVPWFQTDEATDMVAFATAVEKLANAKVRIPAKWVRDEVGAPEADEGEEVIGESAPESDEGTEPVPEDKPEDEAA